MGLVRVAIVSLIILLSILGVLFLLPPFIWWMDIVSWFASSWAIVFLLVVMLGVVVLRRRRAWIITGALLVFAPVVFDVLRLSRATPGCEASPQGEPLAVTWADVGHGQESALREVLTRWNPDVLFARSENPLDLPSYPHREAIAQGEERGWLQIASRFPIQPLATHLGPDVPSYLVTVLQAGAWQGVRLVALAGEPPLDRIAFSRNALYLRRIAVRLRSDDRPTIVGGAFWSSPLSRGYQRMRFALGGSDALQGAVLTPTRPLADLGSNALFDLPLFPLDHLLFRGEFVPIANDVHWERDRAWLHAKFVPAMCATKPQSPRPRVMAVRERGDAVRDWRDERWPSPRQFTVRSPHSS